MGRRDNRHSNARACPAEASGNRTRVPPRFSLFPARNNQRACTIAHNGSPTRAKLRISALPHCAGNLRRPRHPSLRNATGCRGCFYAAAERACAGGCTHVSAAGSLVSAVLPAPALVKRSLANIGGRSAEFSFSSASLLDLCRFRNTGHKVHGAETARAFVNLQPVAPRDRNEGLECSWRAAKDAIGFTAH
jgi:hypothetical protein